VQDLVEQAVLEREFAPFVVDFVKVQEHAFFGRCRFDCLRRAKELADKASDDACCLAARPAIFLDAFSGRVGHDANRDERQDSQQGDGRADA
jgi:hypothetical protein